MLNDAARAHFDKYWRRSREMYVLGDFALAVFLAITLIEEIGKIVILEAAMNGDVEAQKEFRNHREKYIKAVGATLAINARVTRVYGKDEMRFAEWFRNGKLFAIRNSALYLELQGTNLVVPEQAVNRADALLLVCIAGEVYAEIQGKQTGTGPAEWQRILSEVDQFRTQG
jgi:AbiV family abortive infection protein